MTQPVNLNKVRKARARVNEKQRANENALRFGRTKSEKKADTRRVEKAHRHLDGHKTEK